LQERAPRDVRRFTIHVASLLDVSASRATQAATYEERMNPGRIQGVPQVGHQVVGLFDADREPQQIVGDA
jgi:hypothetical protein